MKRPFRSRPEHDPNDLADDYDDGGLDTVGLASGALGRRSILGDPEPDLAPDDYAGYDDYGRGVDDEREVTGPGLIGRRLRRNRRPLDDDDLPPTGESLVVTADEFADGLERYHTDAIEEQRSAWAYLVVLGAMFVALTLFGWACTDESASEVAVSPSDGGGASHVVRLGVRIEGDNVTLDGAVPDEGARTQLVEAAAAIYGADNVDDQLRVEESTTFESGTIRFLGRAVIGDVRPEQLQGRLAEQVGLEDRGFEIQFVEEVLNPVAATVEVTTDVVTANGVLPDEESITDLTALLTETFGITVDAAGLTVGPTTWTEGSITVSGTVSASDPRVQAFGAAATERLGTLVSVDTSALSTADDPALVTDVQARVAAAVTADPIQFAPNSGEIAPESDAVLSQLAGLLNEVPATPVELVGHTDSVGEEADNQTLSETRAAAVVDRLVELGVSSSRLTSRGEGEVNPIADNATEEGKAANRRIDFVLAGSVDGG